MELAEALSWARAVLAQAGVEEPALDAEILLGRAAGLDRAGLFTWADRALTPKQLARFRSDIYRRVEREPLAYIVGQREFFGLSFDVTPAVLIPRPETELLVEEAIHWLTRSQAPASPRVADVGTGSGIIAVTLAVHVPGARVYATDASPEALEVARANALQHGVADRIVFLAGDLLAPVPHRVDLVAANLPYVAHDEWSGLLPEIRDHEPRQALDGGADGLRFIRRLLEMATEVLRPHAALGIEIGARQGTQALQAARLHFPAAHIELRQDYAGLDRLLVVQL